MNSLLKSLVFLLGLCSAAACHDLAPRGKKNAPKKEPAVIDLKKGGYFDRVEKGTTGTLNFFTAVDALCEIRYWPITAAAGAQNESAVTLPCPNETPKKDFSVTLAPLKPDSLYRIEIHAWPSDSPVKDQYEPFTIDEPQGGHTFFGEKPPLAPNEIGEVLIAKIDLPLGSGFLYRHEFEGGKKKEDLAKLLERKTGCFDSRTDYERFEGAAKIARIVGVSIRGFATGIGLELSGGDDRVLVEFQKGLQEGDQWEWNFRYLNTSHTLTMRPGGTFSSVTVESKDLIILDRTNFDDGLKELNMEAKNPLKLSWKSANFTKNSYVTVQLGHSALKSAVFCTFAADAESGTIEEKYLQNIPNGSHYLLIALEDGRIQLGKGNSQPSWVFTSYDWRAIKVNKL
jgi:hypothetical protein